LLGALTNSRGHRHEENAARLVNVALEQPVHVGAALLASAEAYTPTAQRLVDGARERLGTIEEVANALADNLPQAKQPSGKSRRRRRRKKRQAEAAKAGKGTEAQNGQDAAPPAGDGEEGKSPERKPSRRRPRKKAAAAKGPAPAPAANDSPPAAEAG
jgi:hypothetical protein